VGTLVGHGLDGSVLPMVLGIVAGGIGCLLSYLLWVRPGVAATA
ncbi:MAG: Bcr/CflA family drug resistance efflux transporter, partial [Rhodocyclales bacterium]|nr:Bcr/CflA family drug resistance efflux transporter [Rhodocyclales bacterium]